MLSKSIGVEPSNTIVGSMMLCICRCDFGGKHLDFNNMANLGLCSFTQFWSNTLKEGYFFKFKILKVVGFLYPKYNLLGLELVSVSPR